MKQLFVIDLNDYSDNMPVYEKHCVRAIIIRDGKYVMQLSSGGEYKLPGGGIEKGETHLDALEREVMEETGFKIKRDTAVPIGEVTEVRRDRHSGDMKYVCHSYYYTCETEAAAMETDLSPHEQMQGYKPVTASAREIINVNRQLNLEKWQLRDTMVIEMLAGQQLI